VDATGFGPRQPEVLVCYAQIEVCVMEEEGSATIPDVGQYISYVTESSVLDMPSTTITEERPASVIVTMPPVVIIVVIIWLCGTG